MKTILCTTSTFKETEQLDGFNIEMNPYGRKLSESELIKLVERFQPSGVIAGIEPWTKKVFSAAHELVVLSRCGIGLDSIDLLAADNLGVKVLNTPEAPVQSVAELAVSYAFALSRKLIEMTSSIRDGDWPKGAPGTLITGKTVGIMGCGRIGSRVADIFRNLGCSVLGYDPYLTEHTVCRLVSLPELLQASDIVSLHLPITDLTRHIIDADALEMMLPHALLINTARGGLIDEQSLYVAMKDHLIGGAALDVFEMEPYQGALQTLEGNMILTPHIASSTVEGRKIMECEAWRNLVDGLRERGLYEAE